MLYIRPQFVAVCLEHTKKANHTQYGISQFTKSKLKPTKKGENKKSVYTFKWFSKQSKTTLGCGVAQIGCGVAQIGCGVAQIGCVVAQIGCGVAQTGRAGLLYGRPGFESRIGTSEEALYRAESHEDNKSGLLLVVYI